ncbi:Cytochrome P450 [Trinorchestia longiramus]|nr:Cytochrome P450 [Trinorchestia longiramus]
MPPGSYGLPFFGDLPSGKIPITEHMRKLKKKYGNIFTTKWGSLPIVVLTDYRQIKKALQHPDINGRSEKSVVKMFQCFENRGVVITEGEVWDKNRSFLINHLGKLGMGKTALEGSIQDEAAMLIHHLEKSCVDEPVSLETFINIAVGNVTWLMTASKRYEIGDEEGLYYFQTLLKVLDVMEGKILILEIFPFLWDILPTFIMNKVFKLDVGFKYVKEIQKFSEVLVREHLKSLDPHNPRDIVDHYALLHPERDVDGFLIENDAKELIANMFDLFISGSETVATTIRWIMLYMILYPDIQAKIHKILDETVPKDRLPTLADRDQLHYLNAMILDAMRLSSVAPTSVLRRVTADVAFEGYTIPKNTLVMACHELCHRDEAAWEKPDHLHPEHFLDEDGLLKGKRDNFLPFSVGRRQCLAESLARMELYIFMAAILQRFIIQSPEGQMLDTKTDPSKFVLNRPKPFKVLLKKRI